MQPELVQGLNVIATNLGVCEAGELSVWRGLGHRHVWRTGGLHVMLSSSNGVTHGRADARADRGLPYPCRRNLHLDQQHRLSELHRWRLVPPAPLG